MIDLLRRRGFALFVAAGVLAMTLQPQMLPTPVAQAVIGPCTPGFSQPAGSPFTTGNNPGGVAVGNFNADAFADLAITNAGSNNVTILLGNGGGGFVPAGGSPVAAGDNPWAVAVGDFNEDGNADLVVSNASDDTMTILLGNGSGGFTQASGSPVAVGNNPRAIAVADFNGDGHSDFAVVNYQGNNVSILLGNGQGQFPSFTLTAPVGGNPYGIAAGRFDGDAFADLAVANAITGSVSILLGNGAGTFSQAPGSPVSTIGTAVSVAIGHFNGDAIDDLAVGNDGAGNFSILLGNGDGTFLLTPASPIGIGPDAYPVKVGRLNNDALDDVVLGIANGNGVAVMLGDGTGGFLPAPGSPFTVGNYPLAVALGNFNGDGTTDIAVTNSNGNNATILLNSCVAADLSVTVADAPDPVLPGGNLSYTLTAQNNGPDAAATVTLNDILPVNTTFVSLTAPAGWNCTTPAVGSPGTVTCAIGNLAVGTSQFTLVVQVGAGVAGGTIITNTVNVDAATSDSAGGNNSATTTSMVAAATATLTPTMALTPTATVTGTPPATATPTATATATSTPTPSPTPFAATANNSGSGDKKDKDEQAKETEDQQRQRERTNTSGRDEYATEGNVLSVDATASPPTITIANRDGIVTLVWAGPRDEFPSVRPGDYIQVDGEKITEQLYEITDLSKD